LTALGLNARQVTAVLFVKDKGQITNSEYQQLNSIGKSVAAAELQQLADQKILSRVGNTGRSTRYIIYKGES
jgi:ATP-dependent DNA helicase RecG